jgi:putative ABC transport system ATP-binding protein
VAELRAIRKIYNKPDGSILVEALRGIDLDITSGEYLAIMGASGSGKSTLMNILGCLDHPSEGSYRLDGISVLELDDDAISEIRGRSIGFVFQAFNLVSELDVIENVAMPLFYQGLPRSQRRAKAVDRLEMVGLGDRLTHRPKQLSGGEQQRVAIARALVTNPALVLADEPTGNLDTATGTALLDLFEELNSQGMTLVVVTHDDVLSKRCERIVRLRDGMIELDTATNGRPT